VVALVQEVIRLLQLAQRDVPRVLRTIDLEHQVVGVTATLDAVDNLAPEALHVIMLAALVRLGFLILLVL
jgi:hypothetical protein